MKWTEVAMGDLDEAAGYWRPTAPMFVRSTLDRTVAHGGGLKS